MRVRWSSEAVKPKENEETVAAAAAVDEWVDLSEEKK